MAGRGSKRVVVGSLSNFTLGVFSETAAMSKHVLLEIAYSLERGRASSFTRSRTFAL